MTARDEVSYARLSEDLDENMSYPGCLIDPERPHSKGLPKSSTTAHTATLVDGHPSRHHSAYGEVSYARASIVSNRAERDRPANGLKPVQRQISLYTPVSMVSLFLSGILVAVGHHLFYSRFDRSFVHEVNKMDSKYLSQEWIIRYGTAFAFVAKTLLAGSVMVAYRQHMWITLQHKDNRLSTVDAVFAAPHDLLALLSPSMFLKAKIATSMALLAWYYHLMYQGAVSLTYIN
jgi:hypothetical protein